MNNEKVRTYLRECDDRIVNPAISNGLDAACRYLYFTRIYQFFTKNSDLRRRYGKLMEESGKDMAEERPLVDKDDEMVGRLFELQCTFMDELLLFIKRNVVSEETRELAKVQLLFIQEQLRNQTMHIGLLLSIRGLESPGEISGTFDHISSFNKVLTERVEVALDKY